MEVDTKLNVTAQRRFRPRFVVLGVAVLLVLGALAITQWRLTYALCAAMRGLALPESRPASGLAPVDKPSPVVAQELERLAGEEHGACPPLVEINLQYVKQLLFTLSMMLPVGVLLAMAAYCLAVVDEQLDRRGMVGHLGAWVLDFLLDSIPYILWTIPFILVALKLHRSQVIPYWAYLFIIFSGFGMFLVPFFFRQNRERLKSKGALLDAMRLSGATEAGLYWRLFRLEFLRGAFPRQCLYATVFIMLLDYSFLTILKVRQTGEMRTVFQQGNHYQEQMLDARADRGGGRHTDYERTLTAILKTGVLRDREATKAVRDTLRKPFLALDAEYRLSVNGKIRNKIGGLEKEEDRREVFDLMEKLRLRPKDQEMLFFHELSRFYLFLNTSVIFVLFVFVFVVFDTKVLLDE